MDKEWMKLPTPSLEYLDGVKMFLEFAFKNVGEGMREIPCPCGKCINKKFQVYREVKNHLIIHGFMHGYSIWDVHGEAWSSTIGQNENEQGHIGDDNVDIDYMAEMVNDIYPMRDDETSDEFDKFHKYMNAANQPLYPGCADETRLSFIVWLFNLKCTGKWPDWSFDKLLGKLNKILPHGTNLPSNFYETKKMVAELGFNYEKIDVCKNDCMLYWKEDGKLSSCKVCNEKRWKTSEGVSENVVEDHTKESKVAIKQLRYLPLIPMLQKLFMSSRTSKYMQWHHVSRRKDGVYRHPADSKAWEHFDAIHSIFSAECRNVRLGLSTDGMNPFTHGASHSIWPVIVVVYNLPPWMCMKHHHFIMPLLIPGPTTPGNNIDVYLKPLIEELKVLWINGVETYDRSTNSHFTMRGALLWTISDYPALGNLMGWAIKGKRACFICLGSTRSHRLRGKECYIGHRRFLEETHKYRFERGKFNGEFDFEPASQVRSGYDILEEIDNINLILGQTTTHTIPNDLAHCWRKKSIFFELPYWRTLLLRHNLDFMHIEKNVCDCLMGTLLGLKGKITF